MWRSKIFGVSIILATFSVVIDTEPQGNKSIVSDNPDVRKCCPPTYFYDRANRSCVSFQNRTTISNETFSNFGLQHCEVITDVEFRSTGDFQIKNGTLVVLGEHYAKGNFCVDRNVLDAVSVRMCRDIAVCQKMRCIRKCCPDGQSFVNGSICVNTLVHGLQFQHVRDFVGNFSDDFAIIHYYPGPRKVFIQDPSNFSLNREGKFINRLTNEVHLPEKQPYCIEHATKNGKVLGHSYFGNLVGPSPPLPTKFAINRVAMILSGIFLVLTMLFYVCTKEIRKVFAKAMISFCSSLLALYTILVYYTFTSKLHYKNNEITCKAIGFSIIYLGFCCFVWLQIISFDIYWTFGSTKICSSDNERRKKAVKRFIFYSLYGWGLPMIITSFSIVFHYLDVLPAPMKIRMGNTKCAIENGDGNYAEIVFRTMPLTVIQIINIVLFVRTVSYCVKVKNEIKKMNDCALNVKKKKKFFARRERFQLVVKLSFTMGILYVFEVASSFVNFNANTITSTIEIIWDFINCLQGFFIFLIFVCKKKNLTTCKKSAAVEKIRKISMSSTRTTTLSSEPRKISQKNGRKTGKIEELKRENQPCKNQY